MARKAYKALYLRAIEESKGIYERLQVAQGQLKELNAVLVPHGRTVLENVPDVDGDIHFAPLEFVAARAYMESNQRYTYPNEGYSQLYTWCGRAIYRVGL